MLGWEAQTDVQNHLSVQTTGWLPQIGNTDSKQSKTKPELSPTTATPGCERVEPLQPALHMEE